MNYYEIKKIIISKETTHSFKDKNYYIILVIVKGNATFRFEEGSVLCGTEDLIIIKPGNEVQMTYDSKKSSLELILLKIHPHTLELLSTDKTDLRGCFDIVPFKSAVIHYHSNPGMQIKSIAMKLSLVSKEPARFGHEIYVRGLLSTLIVLIIRACIDSDKEIKRTNRKHFIMDDIFIYIKKHLLEDLSLERLEKEFFISRYHIIREFKKHTGMTPHAYIIKSRLDLSRSYIENGYSIGDVYKLSGFNDYNHFFRSFKKQYGLTPKAYYKSIH